MSGLCASRGYTPSWPRFKPLCGPEYLLCDWSILTAWARAFFRPTATTSAFDVATANDNGQVMFDFDTRSQSVTAGRKAPEGVQYLARMQEAGLNCTDTEIR